VFPSVLSLGSTNSAPGRPGLFAGFSATMVKFHTGLRDRALLGVLAYTFARIGAVVNLKVEDYYPSEAAPQTSEI
jgi:integrase